jgi:hypothetical protein
LPLLIAPTPLLTLPLAMVRTGSTTTARKGSCGQHMVAGRSCC